MPGNYVDIAYGLAISASSTGTKPLEDVVRLSVEKNHPSAAVKTMNRRRRARGFQHGTPEYSAELVVAVQVGDEEEVDYDDLQRTKEYFLLAWREGAGGKRKQLVDCVVENVSDPFEEEGGMRRTVRVMALDYRRVPA